MNRINAPLHDGRTVRLRLWDLTQVMRTLSDHLKIWGEKNCLMVQGKLGRGLMRLFRTLMTSVFCICAQLILITIEWGIQVQLY